MSRRCESDRQRPAERPQGEPLQPQVQAAVSAEPVQRQRDFRRARTLGEAAHLGQCVEDRSTIAAVSTLSWRRRRTTNFRRVRSRSSARSQEEARRRELTAAAPALSGARHALPTSATTTSSTGSSAGRFRRATISASMSAIAGPRPIRARIAIIHRASRRPRRRDQLRLAEGDIRPARQRAARARRRARRPGRDPAAADAGSRRPRMSRSTSSARSRCRSRSCSASMR